MDDLNQGYKIGPHIVSGTWKYLFPEEFEFFRFPAESKSSCNDCPKVGTAEFHPDYRCCTYHPRIPNYLLGLALEDDVARPLVEKMINEGYATPEGMQHTPKQFYSSLNQNAYKKFGKEAEVLCRYLDTDKGMCQVYVYRNSICSTFFCANDHKDDGVYFWERMQFVVGQVETALSQWCMDQVGLSAVEYFGRFNALGSKLDQCSASDSEAWSEFALESLWGEHFSDQKGFFLKCAEFVRQNKHKLYEICCDVQLRNANKFEEAFRDSLPEPLRREMDSEGSSTGTPAPIEDLWYLLKKSQRDISMLMASDSNE